MVYIAGSPVSLIALHITNMTKEDYLSGITGTTESRKEAEDILENYLQPFSEVIDRFVPNNMSQRKFDKLVEIMSQEVAPDKCPNCNIEWTACDEECCGGTLYCRICGKEKEMEK